MATEYDLTRIRHDLLGKGLLRSIDFVESTGSTNADLLAARPSDGAVLLAGEQTAGRGRLGRRWESPAGDQLIFSLGLVVDEARVKRLGTLPLAVGAGVADAVVGVAPNAGLKWPNDVLIDGRKLAGILAEAAPLEAGKYHVVVGCGINTGMPAERLPVAHATSLRVCDIEFDQEKLAVAVLGSVEKRVQQWRADDPQMLQDYRQHCVTIGQRVKLETPRGEIVGLAETVDDEGCVVVDGQAYSAGDVTHLRPRQ
ncbi:biotin--[acetyl-CoA-carboxylase] ligase [Corynebacterium tapiri]|uniref:biotin--[biotin carboxyl-carrier protein] ligase n=1 Tax=Corynebacterium tapiri TaxID=1448266 RepID=A0A5C4U434_9CORY|nr:biotin--[acetyl-CoA-carboxylase] ligase [Corynebacterium tapiri]TNL98439.1 biotin--[acetyl-CoA-carboxylase] ligase [Corynebacterium tapiri]